MMKLISDGLNEYEAWNNSTVLLTQLSKVKNYDLIPNNKSSFDFDFGKFIIDLYLHIH